MPLSSAEHQTRRFVACPLALAAVLGLASCATETGSMQRPAPAIPLGMGGASQVRPDPLARAEMLRRQGFTDQALSEFERAIAINPRLTVAYMGAGDIYRERGDYTPAEQRYSKAADLEPGNFAAQYLHGLTLQLLDRVSDSVRAYLRALSIRPEDFNANLNVATAYLQLNEPSQGAPYAEKAVHIDTNSAPARVNLGAIYSAMGRFEEAVVEYQQAAELMELSSPLLLNLAEAYGKSGRYEEMMTTLERVVQTEPTAVAYERLGSALFRLRKYPESLGAYRKAVEIDPNYFPALNGIAVNQLNTWIFSKQTDDTAHREAVSALKRSLQIERNQPRVVELLSTYQ